MRSDYDNILDCCSWVETENHEWHLSMSTSEYVVRITGGKK